MTGDLAWDPEPDDIRFYDVYGDRDPLTPRELAALIEGCPRPVPRGHRPRGVLALHAWPWQEWLDRG